MSYDLYECKDGEIITFTDKIINQIRNLKSSISNNSGYTPDGRMLQWRHSDNNDISESEFDQLVKYIHVEYHHEALLRKLYINNEESSDGSAVITTGFKRPFGNSYVEGDIAEEMEATFKIYGISNF